MMARQGAVTRGDLARGAGLAGLSRLGALIEALAQPLYTWLFGIATYGLYVVLWGAVSLLTNLIDLSMTNALQRVVPAKDTEEQAHAAVKLALIVSVLPAMLVALLVTLNAEALAGIFSAAPEDEGRLPLAIALFVWALPLWTFVEVATSAARARRAFGPEIRLRIFWEQIARILFAVGFFLIGVESIGLMAAHLCSLALTAALCLPLLARYYDLGLLVRAPIPGRLGRELILSGLALLPANLSRRMLIDAPPLVLNLLLPGARGAAAAGLFEIARKLSTVPHIVRQSFQYVLAPLSSAQAALDRARIAPLYQFASRVSTALVVPLAGLLVFAGRDILSVYRPEAAAALILLYILAAGRALEAIVGPAGAIVEMTGHRILPLINSLIGVGLWAALCWLLVPAHGATGMAIAVAAAVVASAWAATVELRLSDGLTPFDRKLFQGLAVTLTGVLAMSAVEYATGGPVRFVAVLALWAGTSWLALRYGLTREDRLALGGLSRRLRLV
jgi:O-antigen/teichoic acid export membrane protein